MCGLSIQLQALLNSDQSQSVSRRRVDNIGWSHELHHTRLRANTDAWQRRKLAEDAFGESEALENLGHVNASGKGPLFCVGSMLCERIRSRACSG